jgi:hypothetical protein
MIVSIACPAPSLSGDPRDERPVARLVPKPLDRLARAAMTGYHGMAPPEPLRRSPVIERS